VETAGHVMLPMLPAQSVTYAAGWTACWGDIAAIWAWWCWFRVGIGGGEGCTAGGQTGTGRLSSRSAEKR
jgi:hypothetical protein